MIYFLDKWELNHQLPQQSNQVRFDIIILQYHKWKGSHLKIFYFQKFKNLLHMIMVRNYLRISWLLYYLYQARQIINAIYTCLEKVQYCNQDKKS
ncbi:unnamed protein product [Paramecium primaurelia]|uniref:Uncharacterized protein n=1 Tax=Paramecium primaurelia TaxID=5886 RepID=A0A8S1LA44_PARPR|nr:unnamed protein product [Paramecium primaurelia]